MQINSQIKMTESQIKEQENQRTIKLKSFDTSPDCSNLEVSFNEIQNILDETIKIIENSNSKVGDIFLV